MGQSYAKTWIKRKCQQCGVRFLARTANIKRGRMKYCSRACCNRARRQHEPVEFAGDLFHLNCRGYYVSTRTDRHLNRVVWEAHYGPVPANCKVYTRDGVRSHYNVTNLYLRELRPGVNCQVAGCQRKARTRGVCQRHLRSA